MVKYIFIQFAKNFMKKDLKDFGKRDCEGTVGNSSLKFQTEKWPSGTSKKSQNDKEFKILCLNTFFSGR